MSVMLTILHSLLLMLVRQKVSYIGLQVCNGSSNANSASAAINKWLKPRVPDNCVIHSFRHSMRDRLRAVECPSDIIDAIGGWTTTGVGQRYGTGQPLKVKAKWMDRLVDQD